MRTIEQLKKTMKVLNVVEFEKCSIVLYKFPIVRPDQLNSYSVETFDSNGKTIDRLTMKHIHRKSEAVQTFNAILTIVKAS